MAAKDQALRTNSIKRMIDKQNVSAKCKMCVEGDETVSHLYRNARNLLKSNIDVGGTTSWRRRFIATNRNNEVLMSKSSFHQRASLELF